MTHLGFFFAWALFRGLVSDFHRVEVDSDEPLQMVFEKKKSPRDYVVRFCDSQLTNEDFTDVGNAIVEYYYTQHYFHDFSRLFEESSEMAYHVEDAWGNAEQLLQVLDDRFKARKEQVGRKPWWKFW